MQKFEEFAPIHCRPRPLGATAATPQCARARPRSARVADAHALADALRWSAQTETAITNGGGIRGGKVYLPGAILTRRDVRLHGGQRRRLRDVPRHRAGAAHRGLADAGV